MVLLGPVVVQALVAQVPVHVLAQVHQAQVVLQVLLLVEQKLKQSKFTFLIKSCSLNIMQSILTDNLSLKSEIRNYKFFYFIFIHLQTSKIKKW